MKFKVLWLAGVVLAAIAGQVQAGMVIGIDATGGGNRTVIGSWLSSQGHTVSYIDSSVASNFTGLDTFLSIRGNFDAGRLANVSAFVSAGGGLVTEWSSIQFALSMFGGTGLGNNFIGTNTTIDINGVLHPVTNGISDFNSGGQTEFNWNSNITGTTLTLLGTIASQNAIMVGTQGSGRVVGLSFDWQDSPWSATTGSADSELNELLLNSVNWAGGAAQPVPEPASLAMWGVGALGVMFARRKRQQIKLAA
ncbi:MAG: PEP-CTERM sorting domain-containing protein [Planctomyces sp.]|nr:PEP-CTERM sorting domain-containing protein [Planctomyces sp.]